MLLIGVCITLAGIAIIGYAGSLRSKNMTEEEKRAAVKDFALTKGLLVALLAGVMSACFALGLDAGTPIKEAGWWSRSALCRITCNFPGNSWRFLYECRLLYLAEYQE